MSKARVAVLLLCAVSSGVWAQAAYPKPGEPPAFCEGYKQDKHDGQVKRFKAYKSEGFTPKVLAYAGGAICDKPTDAERRKEFDGWRDEFIAATGASADDFAEAIALAMSKDGQAQRDALCDKFKASPDAPLSEQNQAKLTSNALECTGWDIPMRDWNADTFEPTVFERGVYLHQCLKDAGAGRPMGNKDPPSTEPLLALCLPELRALDLDAFEQAAAAQADSRAGKHMLKMLAGDLKRRAKIANDFIGKLEKDKDYKRVTDASARGFKEFGQTYAKNKELFVAGRKVVDELAKSDSQMDGLCNFKFESALASEIKAKKPKTADDVVAVMDTAAGFYSWVGAAACAVEHGGGGVTQAYLTLRPPKAGSGPRSRSYNPHRGPRFEATLAAQKELFAILEKRPNFELKTLRGGDTEMYKAHAKLNSWGLSGGSVDIAHANIAALKPGKQGVQVTFKNETITVTDSDCKETNKIDRIDSNGKIYYQQICWATGSHKETVKHAPVVVPAEYARGLKPGQHVWFQVKEVNKTRFAAPLEAYGDPADKKLASFLGFEL